MKLTTKQSYELLAKHGVYVKECCDKCSQALGAVSFTRRGEPGVWCSRECRGEWPVVLKAGRPRKYRDGRERRTAKTEQQRSYRLRPSVEKTVCTPLETKDLQAQKSPLSHYPLTPLFPALERTLA